MFERSRELLDQYVNACIARTAAVVHQHLYSEVSERLRQLDYIIDRIRSREDAHEVALRDLCVNMNRAYSASGAIDEAAQFNQAFWRETGAASMELRVLSEAFYYFAARIRGILRHKDRPLPYLYAFEAPGVRDVRNHLIEHPEGQSSGIFAQCFVFGGPHGPILKAGRPASEGGAYPDVGLYRNAEEFRFNMEKELNKAIAALARVQR